jgi:hypothetical protein
MARKQKGQEAPAKDGAIFVTYVGELSAVVYRGATFLRGVPVPVEDASVFLNRPSFEVSRANAD